MSFSPPFTFSKNRSLLALLHSRTQLRWSGVFWAYLLWTMTACQLQGYECRTLEDCASQQICQQGWCKAAPQAKGGPCQQDSDCKLSLRCQQRQCKSQQGSRCQLDEDCPKGMGCKERRCQPSFEPCKPGALRFCYPSKAPGCLADSLGNFQCLAPCQMGRQSCQQGRWSRCIGAKLPQREICNGKDDDCDGSIDEQNVCGVCQPGSFRSCYPGSPTTLGQGPCKEGRQICQPNASWGECTGAKLPQQETCNGKDDDCDGQTDNIPHTQQPLFRHCYGGPANTRQVGRCRDGKEFCQQRRWSGQCENATLPRTETCNGEDDDCNGQTDEGLGQLTCGQGRCQRTFNRCQLGRLVQCKPNEASPKELCSNQVDDDCDGSIDEADCLCIPIYPEHNLSNAHNHGIFDLSFSSDGKRLATASTEGTITLWDIPQQNPIRTLQIGNSKLHRIALSADGSQLLVGTKHGRQMALWNVDTGQQVRTFATGKQHSLRDVAFSPDKQQVVANFYDEPARDSVLRIWDKNTGQSTQTIYLQTKETQAFAIRPDNQAIATLNRTQLRVWSLPGGKILRTWKVKGSSILTYSPKGKYIATNHNNGAIKVWNPVTGKEHRSFIGHPKQTTALRFHPTLPLLYSGGTDGTYRVWNLQTNHTPLQQTIQAHQATLHQIVFSPDNSALVTASQDKTIHFWDPIRHQKLPTLDEHFQGHQGTISRLLWGPNENWFASASQDKTVRLWNIRRGQLQQILHPHEDNITDIGIHPRGTHLFSVVQDRHVQEWAIPSGKPTRRLNNAPQPRSIAVRPDGKRVAIGTKHGSIYITDLKTGQQVHIIHAHKTSITTLEYSHDSKYIATGSLGLDIALWDAGTGQQLQTFRGHQKKIHRVSFSTDGKWLLTSSEDRNVRIWDAQTGTPLKSFQIPGSSQVSHAQLSYDQKLLFIGTNQSTWVWDVASTKLLIRLRIGAHHLLLRRDSKQLITSGWKGELSTWNCSPLSFR